MHQQAQARLEALRLVPADAVGADVDDWLGRPHYNIAPSRPVLVARTRGRTRRTDGPARRVDLVRWGLIPRRAQDPAIGNKLALARAETVAEKLSYRDAWAKARRCLIWATAFYEWQDVGDATADPRNGDPGTTGTRPVARRPKRLT